MSGLSVGVDLAIAKRKRLPIAAGHPSGTGIKFLRLRSEFPPPPSGMGNARALDERERARFVADVAEWLRNLERRCGEKISRIAIDAPSQPCREDRERRLAEISLDREGISCFSTPTRSEFAGITAKALEHLIREGSEARLPFANKIWMLVGFDLFKALRAEWPCIEVYPQAIIRCICGHVAHKTEAIGFVTQLDSFARTIGTSAAELDKVLRTAAFGAFHDRLDAMMSAWVASLSDSEIKPYGDGTDDVIWVPRMTTPEFFPERRAQADLEAFDRLMRRKGGEPPRTGDELPEP